MPSSLPAPRGSREGGDLERWGTWGGGGPESRRPGVGSRAGAGGRARPGGPHPGVPSPAAIEDKEEDDFQIHSEGGATELGAVSALLNHPGRVQGRPRWGVGAPGTLHDQSLAPFLFQGRRKKIFFEIFSSQPCRTLPLLPASPGCVTSAIPGLGPFRLHFPNSGTGSPESFVVSAVLQAPLSMTINDSRSY